MNNNQLYCELASLCQARQNCVEKNNDEWERRHAARIESLVKSCMPSGSGFDSGTKIDLVLSDGERLVFDTSFHHMNDNGMYDGWTDHRVIVSASLLHGFRLSISGRNRNEIKEYIHEMFEIALSQPVTELAIA